MFTRCDSNPTRVHCEDNREARMLYKDFAILSRIQIFNQYAENHFNPESPGECEMMAFMYLEIESLINDSFEDGNPVFNVLNMRDDAGNEIPILDQLNPQARAVAERHLG